MEFFNKKTLSDGLAGVQSIFTTALDKAKELQNKLNLEKQTREDSIKTLQNEIDKLSTRNNTFVGKLNDLISC